MSPYLEEIRDEFTRRASRNPQYSWSAFARDLGVTPARLHSIVSGKSGLSVPAAEKMARRMGQSDIEVQRFCALVASQHGRSRQVRAAARAKIEGLSSLSERGSCELQGVSTWYHLALMELIQFKYFRNDESWIAARLGVNQHLVRPAIDALVKAGLVVDDDGSLKLSSRHNIFGNGAPSSAVRAYHASTLEMAKEAIFTMGVDDRYLVSSVFPVRKSEIDKVRTAIQNCLAEIRGCHAQDGEAEELLSVSMQVVTITKEVT